MNTYVITFESTHTAMAASKTLASGGIDFWTIPTPREISAGCGIALRFSAETPDEAVGRVFGSTRNSGRGALYLTAGEAAYEKLLDL
ncbi:MAG: DUF3343 domain-containing protein [Coriobacteriia bacterium]|nr:DUF3343 domain-containing protein [Coriobacteriia bacterium]